MDLPEANKILTARKYKMMPYALTLTVFLFTLTNAWASVNLHVMNGYNGRVYTFTPSGVGSVFANTGFGTGFILPMAVDSSGNVFTFSNGNIYKVTPAGTVSNFITWGSPVRDAQFDSLGNLYVTSGYVITKITPAGVATTFATGSYSAGYTSLVFDNTGNLFTIGNGNLIKITQAGVQSTIASGLSMGIDFLGLAADSQGNVFSLSYPTRSIIKITPNGTVSTFATGLTSGIFDGLAIDSADNLYVANTHDQNIYKFTSSGVQSTFVTGFSPTLYGESLTFGPPSAVPEPSSVLLGVGLSIAGFLSTIRRNRSSR